MDISTIAAISQVADQAANHFMNFVTVYFAYIVAVHFIGNRIPLRFAIAITLVYSGFCLLPAIANINDLQRLYLILGEQPELLGGGPPRFARPLVPAVVMASAWATSVWYLVHVRRAKAS
jgi:hypothetical protein